MEETSKTLCEDLLLLAELIHKEKRLHHHSVLITGATGLIGSLLAKAIMLANQRYRCDIDLILVTHSHEKADRIFSNSPAAAGRGKEMELGFYSIGKRGNLQEGSGFS